MYKSKNYISDYSVMNIVNIFPLSQCYSLGCVKKLFPDFSLAGVMIRFGALKILTDGVRIVFEAYWPQNE